MPIAKSLTTPFPNGVTNAKLEGTLASAGFPDPTYANVDVDDFNRFLASDWTITKVGTGTAALAAGAGGDLLLTTTAGATDSVLFQRAVATQTLAAGKQAFFKISFQLSDATNCAVVVGLINTTTTPLAPTDGVYLYKATGQTAWVLTSMVGSVATTAALPASLVSANNTQLELGIVVDWLGNVLAYFNPLTGTQVILNAITATQARGRVAQINQPTLTAAGLNLSFGLTNGAAAAKTMTVDYVLAAVER